LCEIPQAACDEYKIESYLKEKITSFFEQWKSTNFQPGDRVLSLSFYEKRVKSVYWGLSKAEEKFCWEQWFVTVSVDTSAHLTSPITQLSLSKSLKSNITKILRIANEEFGHVPPLVKYEFFLVQLFFIITLVC
jgi:hypothetical protein